MGNNRKQIKRNQGIKTYLSEETDQKLTELCEYIRISKGEFLSIYTDYIYDLTFLYGAPTTEELAEKYEVSVGVIKDVLGYER